MFVIRPIKIDDLFLFNSINLDHWTETFFTQMYLGYLSRWPSLCLIAHLPDATFAGYLLAKVEGVDQSWHGHITALSVAPQFRRSGLARKLMATVESYCDSTSKCYFMDLYVRKSNDVAKFFYLQLGYEIWRIVPGYYSGQEDALEMRKPLSMDPNRLCLKENIGQGKKVINNMNSLRINKPKASQDSEISITHLLSQNTFEEASEQEPTKILSSTQKRRARKKKH